MTTGATETIRNIKCGESVTIKARFPREINTIRSIIYRLNSTEPERGKKYSCVSNFSRSEITVTANPL